MRWALNRINAWCALIGFNLVSLCGWGSYKNTSCTVVMAHFDERSGLVYCKTEWGQWGQTIEEVFVEVDVPEGTKARDIRCDIKPKAITVAVNKTVLFQV